MEASAYELTDNDQLITRFVESKRLGIESRGFKGSSLNLVESSTRSGALVSGSIFTLFAR